MINIDKIIGNIIQIVLDFLYKVFVIIVTLPPIIKLFIFGIALLSAIYIAWLIYKYKEKMFSYYY
jgi:presenilin-like A22 family membrane protease